MSLVALGLVCARASASAQAMASMPERSARHAQREFEYLRRALLPSVPARTGGCDLTIGDVCYWDDNDDAPLPPERPRVAVARDHLRASLDSLGAIDSANDYIVGQRVRYAVEAHDVAAAAAVVRHCAATPWWCDALRGLAAHRAGAETASAAAFDSALAEMPDTTRCAWLDARSWLPSGTRVSTGHGSDCAERAAVSERVFWMAAPLLTWRRNAARDEYFSRRTWAKLLEGTVNPQYSSWRWDSEEMTLRFGWPDQWAREAPPIGTMLIADVNVVGDEPRPSFSVVPDRRALESPFTAKPGDWRLSGDRDAFMRYAPGWLRSIDMLPVQIARFRRPNDSMVVVAVYDGHPLLDSGSTTFVAAASLSAGLETDSTLAFGAAAGVPTGAIVLGAPARPALASVEVFDSVGGRAARWRAGLAPLSASAAMSDLLVGRAGSAGDASSLDSAARSAVPRLRFSTRDTLTLYWETYFTPPPGTRMTIGVRLTKAAGALGRVGHALGLVHAPAGSALSWEDAAADSSHSLRLGLAEVTPGRYRLEITVDTPSVHGSASRDVEVVD
ncbi:MAG TPA: hypothetical protein VJO52_02680 [Gemmatimonadaceae bacterium]|nr:hypothetical protein [Gemmatimonadaceae bacterium]